MFKLDFNVFSLPLELKLWDVLYQLKKHQGVLLFSGWCAPHGHLAAFNPVVEVGEAETLQGHDRRQVNGLDYLDQLIKANSDLKIPAGFLGYISYDYLDRFEEPGLFKVQKDAWFTALEFKLYEYYVYFDWNKANITVYRLIFPFNYNPVDFDQMIQSKNPESFGCFQSKNIESIYEKTTLDELAFKREVDKIRDYIARGDVYQVNLTRAVLGQSEWSDLELAYRLYHSNTIEMGVIDFTQDKMLVSTSPERFFQIKDGKILASPIKGTAPRFRDSSCDAESKAGLMDSVKNRAELAMIVDLLRNDISRISRPGSVEVLEFPVLMALQNVYHLVADIQGELRAGLSLIDIFKALFPGGSITGCPKIRACQIIQELEPLPRGPYTGSFGLMFFNNTMDFNILIRTLFYDAGRFRFDVGGGITLLSEPQEEFHETNSKGRNMAQALNLEEKWMK